MQNHFRLSLPSCKPRRGEIISWEVAERRSVCASLVMHTISIFLRRGQLQPTHSIDVMLRVAAMSATCVRGIEIGKVCKNISSHKNLGGCEKASVLGALSRFGTSLCHVPSCAGRINLHKGKCNVILEESCQCGPDGLALPHLVSGKVEPLSIVQRLESGCFVTTSWLV